MIKENKILLLLSLLLAISMFSFAQISPGDLVEAHSHLEGMSNCTLCHVLGDKVTNEKCLDCHKEIQTRRDENKGYHASSEVKGKECASCHNDHHGRNFEIIRFKKDTFNHSLTQYELKGKHAELDCEKCHKKDFIIDKKLLEKNKTYLGLGQECLNCHADYHQKTLSKNCSDCHDHKAFKPVANFDHNKTDFRLKGKHRDVDCIKCHKKEIRNGEDFQHFSGIKFAKCTDCHEDVHKNKFGQNCTECHTENSFLTIKTTKNFNHNLTNYPLKGLHQKVDCKACHKGKLTDALAHETCTDCHKDDHKNELDVQGQDPVCSDCHSVNGFKPSSYSIEKHNQSKFALNGAHLATPCFACHLKENDWHFREIGSQCIDCHKDNHKGLISEKFYPNQDCKVCHVEDLWASVKFDHNQTEFKLQGAHQKQDCRACHFPKSEAGLITQKFNSFTDNCTDCHNDIHLSQFEKNGKTDCISCHGNTSFKIADFDHNKTKFPLDGAHQKVKCIDCHKEKTNEKGKYIEYKIKEFKCADCHS